ncbi:MAG: hypothetical protein EOP88_07765 [Verrucomicrobiaceae bacterium]|nr:MAG: hypothetical protein EOP88_07765 [Verrucomicrobiaceae bacterium]
MKLFQRTPKHNRQWSKTRKLGWLGFTLLFGVVYWGGLMIVLQYIYQFHISSRPSHTFQRFLSSDVPIWLTMGVLWGSIIWYFTERDYQKYLALHPEENPETPPAE